MDYLIVPSEETFGSCLRLSLAWTAAVSPSQSQFSSTASTAANSGDRRDGVSACAKTAQHSSAANRTDRRLSANSGTTLKASLGKLNSSEGKVRTAADTRFTTSSLIFGFFDGFCSRRQSSTSWGANVKHRLCNTLITESLTTVRLSPVISAKIKCLVRHLTAGVI